MFFENWKIHPKTDGLLPFLVSKRALGASVKRPIMPTINAFWQVHTWLPLQWEIDQEVQQPTINKNNQKEKKH